MEKKHDFTQGPILPALLKFAIPVLLALLLQTMYGAVDLPGGRDVRHSRRYLRRVYR